MLKQQTEDGHVAWQSTPPTKPTVSGRFDKNATQDILETAARLQQAEQDTLSQAEIEAMAAEMGISPRHVRQAIALSRRSTAGGHGLPRVRLSLRQKMVVTATILLYAVLVATLHSGGRVTDSTFPVWLFISAVFILPFAVAFWLGSYVRYKRAGAICGGMLTVAMFIALQITFSSAGRGNLFDHGGFWYVLMITCGAIVAGMGGAALRQWLTRRKLSHTPPVVKPSALDR